MAGGETGAPPGLDVEFTTALLVSPGPEGRLQRVYNSFEKMMYDQFLRSYRELPLRKSGAACINWSVESDAEMVRGIGFAFASPDTDLAKLAALRTCRRKYRETANDCKCVVIYADNTRVLQEPEAQID